MKNVTTVTDSTTEPMQSKLKAALAYTKFCRVFPLAPDTKVPLLTGNWASYATNDKTQIETWWSNHPDANIALVMDTNLVTLDIDTKDGKDGYKSFNDILQDNSLPDGTPTQETPSGGQHYLFRHPADRTESFHNATNKGIAGGIDIRSGIAYIVAAPSTVGGVAYEFSTPFPDSIGDIPELPALLVDQLNEWGSVNSIFNGLDNLAETPIPSDNIPSLEVQPWSLLPEADKHFLQTGEIIGKNKDRSAVMYRIAINCFNLPGVTDNEVLSLLVKSPGVDAFLYKHTGTTAPARRAKWLWAYTCLNSRHIAAGQREGVEAAFSAALSDDSPAAGKRSKLASIIDKLASVKPTDDFSVVEQVIKPVAEMGLTEAEKTAFIADVIKYAPADYGFTKISSVKNPLTEWELRCFISKQGFTHANFDKYSGENLDANAALIDWALNLNTAQRELVMPKIRELCKLTGGTYKSFDSQLEEKREIVKQTVVERTNDIVFTDLNTTGNPKPTIANFIKMLDHYGYSIRYNMMSKEDEVSIPGVWGSDNELNNKRTYLLSKMAYHDMAGDSKIDGLMSYVANKYAYHPVKDIIDSVPVWDGVDRVSELIECLTFSDGGDVELYNELIRKWLLSAIAVVYGYGSYVVRGMLVMTGPQDIGKTSLLSKLCFPGTFGGGRGLHTDNKDSIKQAVSTWITELGELDATFRKSDIAALKAFLSNTIDTMRLPYAAKESRFRRMTVFAGTVNDSGFLRDMTGNTRYWTIAVDDIDLDRVDAIMAGDGRAQFWKQIWTEYTEAGGESSNCWSLADEFKFRLDLSNRGHLENTAEEDMLLSAFDWNQEPNIQMTAMEIAAIIGIDTARGSMGARLKTALVKLSGKESVRTNEVNLETGKRGRKRYYFVPPRAMTPGLFVANRNDDLSFLD